MLKKQFFIWSGWGQNSNKSCFKNRIYMDLPVDSLPCLKSMKAAMGLQPCMRISCIYSRTYDDFQVWNNPVQGFTISFWFTKKKDNLPSF